jgi:DNA (cytosine-5)-methyltransferase 3A
MNVLSLFDGISCGQLALERANIKVDSYYASEINQNCIRLTQRHFPNTIQLGDVCKIDDNVLKTLPKIDLLIGGSPCQNLSRAGNGMGLKGDESKLFYEYVRVLKWIKENNNPNIKFLLENVEMKNSNKETINNELETQPILINSKLVSAQNRPRLYWCNFDVDLPNNKNIKLKDILIDENIDLVEKNGLKFDVRLSEKSMDLVFIYNNQIAIKQATKQGFIYAIDGDGINLQFPTSKTRRGRVIKQKSSTLDRQCDCCVLTNNVIRKLNINELEKLQTLPVDYTVGFNENERKSMIGNGWTVDVIVHIFKNLN